MSKIGAVATKVLIALSKKLALSDDEERRKMLIIILSPLICVLLILTMFFYIISHPLEDLKMLSDQNQISDVSSVQNDYGVGVGNEDYQSSGIPLGDDEFQAIMKEATKYIGYPYVFGGSTPETSFDCSGYVCWVYTHAGIKNLEPRGTAQNLYDMCYPVPDGQEQQGDLVFFKGTYASGSVVSHVGIYVGNNKMLAAGDPICYTDLTKSYCQQHFYSYGRISPPTPPSPSSTDTSKPTTK